MTFTDDLAIWLGQTVDGLAYSETTNEGNVFVDRLPQTPDRAVGVFAIPTAAESDAKLPYDDLRFQVIVRSEEGGAWAADMIEKVRDELHALRNTQVIGTYFTFILSTMASAVRLGPDPDARPAYSLDFRAERYRPTTRRPA